MCLQLFPVSVHPSSCSAQNSRELVRRKKMVLHPKTPDISAQNCLKLGELGMVGLFGDFRA